jgi:hypothetical protein
MCDKFIRKKDKDLQQIDFILQKIKKDFNLSFFLIQFPFVMCYNQSS